MKTIIAFLILSSLINSAFAQINPFTKTFLEAETNKNVYILSGGTTCHGPLSTIRNEQIIVVNAGAPTNVYPNQQACEAAGGKLSNEEQQLQLITRTITASNSAGNEQLERESALIQKTIQAMEARHDELQQTEQIAKEKAESEMEKIVETQKEQKFFGINFGLGLAFVQMNDPYVTDVSFNKLTEDDSAQNVIFVNHQAKTKAVAMLESHYFFKNSLITNQPSMEWGHGPFFAISLLSEEKIDLLTNFGAGWMWGFMREDGSSFNIGLGLYVDTKATLLRPEYHDGKMTALDDENLVTYQRDQKGWMFMFSSTF